MGKYEENLIANSMHLLEVDDEEDLTISESENNADIVDIVDHFGTDEFKYLYLNLYDEIYNLDYEKKKIFCQKLELKITEYYNFEFTPFISFESNSTIENFLKFVEFLEFEYIDFIAKIISGLNFNLLKKDINQFIDENWTNIESKINFLVETKKISELISNFFRTNNKEGMIEFVKSKLEKDKMLIILKSMEGEL